METFHYKVNKLGDKLDNIKIFNIMIFILALMLFSEVSAEGKTLHNIEYSTDNTLREISLLSSIPVSKLSELLIPGEEVETDVPLESLGISIDDVETARIKFEDQLWRYSWNIVLVGMIVIFASLIVTGLCVGHLHLVVSTNFPKTKDKIKKSQNVEKVGKYTDIIAAITAVHLHIKNAEDDEKLIIAWNREPVSVWKTSSKFLMPNMMYESKKK